MAHFWQHSIVALGLAVLATGTGAEVSLAQAPDLDAADRSEIGADQDSVAPLANGDRGSAVASLQRLLTALDYGDLIDDGVYGAETETAIRAVQQRYRQSPTGVTTWQTWGVLWASPWQGIAPQTLSSMEFLTAAEKTAQSGPDSSPLWLLIMPAIPLIGGALTYWKRRLLGTTAAMTRDSPAPRTPAKIIRYFPLLGLAVASTTAFGSYVVVRSRLVLPAQQELEALADEQALALDAWFEQQRQGVLDAATAPDILPEIEQLVTQPNRQDPETQAAYGAFATYLDALEGFGSSTLAVSLLTSGGIVVFATDQTREGQYQPLQNTTTYFTREQANQVPNLYVSPLTNSLQITFATPVIDDEGRRLGVLAVDLDLTSLHQQIQDTAEASRVAITERPSQTSYLVGRASLVQNQIISGDRDFQATYPDGVDSYGIETAIAGSSGRSLYLDYDKVPVIGVYRWASRHNLALLVEIDQADVFQPAQQIARRVFTIGLGLTVLLSLLLRGFGSSKPLSGKTAVPTAPQPPSLGDPPQSSPE